MKFEISENRVLSGSDNFHLLLDQQMLRQGLTGNISRIHLKLAANSDLEKLESELNKSQILALIHSLKVESNWLALPVWRKVNRSTTSTPVKLHQNISPAIFYEKVLNRKVDNQHGLVFIDICSIDDGSKHIVIAMHHVLFDHQGMMNFVKALNDASTTIQLFPQPKSISPLKTIWDFVYTSAFILQSSGWKLGTLVGKKIKPASSPKFRVIRFSENETRTIETNAWQYGARLGRSPFYMAVTTKLIFNVLKSRGENPPFFWFSVPHDRRKKGAAGHLVSNQLSFLFFRILAGDLQELGKTVASINGQLKIQILKKIPQRYESVLNVFLRIPVSVCLAMVNRSTNGAVASFAFSDLGESNMQTETFSGCKVEEMLSYPPVLCPPGLSVAVMKENNQLKFVWGYFDEAISEIEIAAMESQLHKLLLRSA